MQSQFVYDKDGNKRGVFLTTEDSRRLPEGRDEIDRELEELAAREDFVRKTAEELLEEYGLTMEQVRPGRFANQPF